MFVSLPGGKSREDISERLQIDKKQVGEILHFLVRTGLVREEKGLYYFQVGRTHLERRSPFLKQHHANWRIKSIQKMDTITEEDFTFTAPLSLSYKDFSFLREEMVKLIGQISTTVKDTTPEDAFCFNIDFFKI